MKTHIIIKYLYFCFVGILYVFIPIFVRASVSINVGKPHIKNSQLAIQPFVLSGVTSPVAIKTGTTIFKILEENLASSGYFTLISQNAFLEKPGEKALEPFPNNINGFIWNNWKLINTDYLLLGQYFVKKNKIHIYIYLYNITSKIKISHKQYVAPITLTKKLSHKISNDIIKILTNKPGIFLTKIVAVRSMDSKYQKELFVMDWTGKNNKQVSFHRSIVLAPSWSTVGDKIAYTAFLYKKTSKKRSPAFVLYNRIKKNRRIISKYKGTYVGSDFLPNGTHILLSLFLGKGYMDIAKMSLIDGSIKALTFGPNGAINVEPVSHPQGKNIVFASDRGGKVTLYSMNNKGHNIKAITSVGRYNSTPRYSPDGKQIVFSGYSEGRFDIFIMNASDSSQLKRLTSFKKANNKWANNESPSFSPDGRYIVFTNNQTGNYQLYIMNLLNKSTSRITTDKYNYKSPRWSPLLL